MAVARYRINCLVNVYQNRRRDCRYVNNMSSNQMPNIFSFAIQNETCFMVYTLFEHDFKISNVVHMQISVTGPP